MLPALENRKPGPRLAFLPEADQELLAEHLIAFANGDGGAIVLGKTQISPEVGYFAIIDDTEGNRVYLHSMN